MSATVVVGLALLCHGVSGVEYTKTFELETKSFKERDEYLKHGTDTWMVKAKLSEDPVVIGLHYKPDVIIRSLGVDPREWKFNLTKCEKRIKKENFAFLGHFCMQGPWPSVVYRFRIKELADKALGETQLTAAIQPLQSSYPVIKNNIVTLPVMTDITWTLDAASGKNYIIIGDLDILLSVTEGQARCRAISGVLPEPRDQRDNEFLANLSTTTILLGLSDRGSEGRWAWHSDGSQVTWMTWIHWERFESEPNGGERENCAVMPREEYVRLGEEYDRRGWEDIQCEGGLFVNDFICEQATANRPNGRKHAVIEAYNGDETCDNLIFDPCHFNKSSCGGNAAGKIISQNPMKIGELVTVRCNSSLMEPVLPVTSVVISLNDEKLTQVIHDWDVTAVKFKLCERYRARSPWQECWTGGRTNMSPWWTGISPSMTPREFIEVTATFRVTDKDAGKYSCVFTALDPASGTEVVRYFYEHAVACTMKDRTPSDLRSEHPRVECTGGIELSKDEEIGDYFEECKRLCEADSRCNMAAATKHNASARRACVRFSSICTNPHCQRCVPQISVKLCTAINKPGVWTTVEPDLLERPDENLMPNEILILIIAVAAVFVASGVFCVIRKRWCRRKNESEPRPKTKSTRHRSKPDRELEPGDGASPSYQSQRPTDTSSYGENVAVTDKTSGPSGPGVSFGGVSRIYIGSLGSGQHAGASLSQGSTAIST